MSDRPAGDPADVLLVEDNPGDVRLTQEAFTGGLIENSPHVVTDGVEAMDFLQRCGDHADAPRSDLVLLDLPQKNGHEVLEETKNDSGPKHIPVRLPTGSDAESDNSP